MRRRARKFIGGGAMLAFVVLYALVAMALAQSRPLQEAPALLFFYPEFYDRLRGLEGKVPVRLYDALQPENDAPLHCSNR